jgi:peptidoglycan hydrolase-like protein with peptidoglycan-binding domain
MRLPKIPIAAALCALALASAPSALAQERAHVLQLQRALAARGFDPGAIDGVMGPQTRQALLSYQTYNEITATGRLDRETAVALGWPRHMGDPEGSRAGTHAVSSTMSSGALYVRPERTSTAAADARNTADLLYESRGEGGGQEGH